jgi:drug/metabolite transporter (DMT)-like permease
VTTRGVLLFGLMAVVWGIAYMLIRIAVAEISPATLVFARTAIGVAVLLPVALLRVEFRPTLRRWRWVVAFAIVEIAIPWLMLASAEQHLSSSLAGLLIAGVPLVSALIAVLSRGADRLGRTGVIGLTIGMAGVAAIVGGDFRADNLTALLQMALVVVGYAIGPAILARALAGLPSLAVMTVSVGMTALLYLPISLATGWPTAVPSWQAIVACTILGVVCTAIGFVAFNALIDEVGPVRATVVTYLNPAVAAILGVLILHETFTLPMAVGFALVILGSAVATRPAQPRPPKAAEQPAEIALSPAP